MRWLAATLLLVVSASTVFAECPEGSYPWFNRRGVEYCKRDVVGPSEPSLASLSNCSYGSRASVDRVGKTVCTKRKKIDRAAGS
jgi:hypothetical protein